MKIRAGSLKIGLLVAGGIVAFDQLTKFLIHSRFHPGEGFIVLHGFFDLRYVRNPGAAWGIFAGSRILLIAFAVFALALACRYARQLFAHLDGGWIIFGLLLGGIVGNLIDRVRFGYVIDFLDFYWRGSHFPAFNVADAAICVGAALLLLAQTLHDRRQHAASSESTHVAD